MTENEEVGHSIATETVARMNTAADFASSIQTANDLAIGVNDMCIGINLYTAHSVMQNGSTVGSDKRSLINRLAEIGLAEVFVKLIGDESNVALDFSNEWDSFPNFP